MRKNWWKWLGVFLTAAVMIGGMLIPLKTGITGVRLVASPESIKSGSPFELDIDMYNFGENFKIQDVIIKNKNRVVRAVSNKWNPEGTIRADFLATLGSNSGEGETFTVYVKGNDQWMAFPDAVFVYSGSSDSGIGKSDILEAKTIQADPDMLKGFPNRPILNESIRNLFFHVPLWFSMIFILALAAVYSIRYLRNGNLDMDLRSDSLIRVALLIGFLGCATGAVWARATWDSFWPRDPKLNGVAIGMLMYLAYFLLRSGIRDEHQKARVSAVYNLFIYPVFLALIAIMPRISGDSLHPGAGGTVTFKQYDMDNTMRMLFYPAVIGGILMYCWMASLLYRYKKLELQRTESES
ncbi:MAG: cytochrome c biogenesis protein CcsA [Bacteroidetes bacterium]|nr:cytochrome c biogenesis protein CcsA [Bacteroidota bacterium]